MRKRSHLVRSKTARILSVQNLYARNKSLNLSAKQASKLEPEDIQKHFSNSSLGLAVYSGVTVVKAMEDQISNLEKVILKQVAMLPEFKKILTVDGTGKIMALTIMLETWGIKRFKKVGNYSSYCRTVSSVKTSSGNKKGKGNVKNGNKYLSCAFVEAAGFLARYNDKAKKYYQRKLAKTKRVVAIKAMANKLSRACYFIMKDQTDFNDELLFPC